MSINLTCAWLNSFFTFKCSIQVSWEYATWTHCILSPWASCTQPVSNCLHSWNYNGKAGKKNHNKPRANWEFVISQWNENVSCKLQNISDGLNISFEFSRRIKVTVVYKNASSFHRDMISLFLIICRGDRHTHTNTEPHKLPREMLNSCCWA